MAYGNGAGESCKVRRGAAVGLQTWLGPRTRAVHIVLAQCGAAPSWSSRSERQEPRGNDCDDTNADVSVALTIFVDADQDGFGAGPGQLACTNGSPPDGFSTTGTDCDDGDASLWALLTYHAIDGDGDGVTVPANGQLCTNGTLPSPFRAT